jgi:hypothetical protein
VDQCNDQSDETPLFSGRYIALYEIDIDDMNCTLAASRERAGRSAMLISNAVAPERAGWCFEPITPKVEAIAD